MNQRINLILASLFSCVFVAGCAGEKVRNVSFQQAQWETKAMIRDQKENKTQSLDIDILAIKNERTRLEVTALLGFRVASLVMSPRDISFAVYPQKRFYYGKNSEHALSRLLDLPLHPMNLANIAFDEPVRGPGWRCDLDQSGWVSLCENPARQLTVKWLDRQEGAKKVVITGPQFEMQWLFNAPQTEVQFKPETFTLKQPEGFKAIQLN